MLFVTIWKTSSTGLLLASVIPEAVITATGVAAAGMTAARVTAAVNAAAGVAAVGVAAARVTAAGVVTAADLVDGLPLDLEVYKEEDDEVDEEVLEGSGMHDGPVSVLGTEIGEAICEDER